MTEETIPMTMDFAEYLRLDARVKVAEFHLAKVRAINADLLAALQWLAPYARVQVERHPDATDTPQWQSVLDAIAKATGSQSALDRS